MQGVEQSNVIPSGARLLLDVRLTPGPDEAAVTREIDAACRQAMARCPGTTIEWHVYCGATVAGQDDVVLGEGDALRFVQPREAAALPYASRVDAVVPRFLASPEYHRLLP